MPSLNKVLLIGNLGGETELRITPNGKPVTNFSMATNSRWVTAEGEKKEQTDWFAIVAWGKLAESCNQYLVKASLVYIEGRVGLRTWTRQDGTMGSKQEVVASKVLFLDKRASQSDSQPNELEPEDIPF